MKIRKFYLKKYPNDELGVQLNNKVTFSGLLNKLTNNNDVYEYIGVTDCLVRERVFKQLANLIEKPYDYVYDLWMNQKLINNINPPTNEKIK